MPSDQKCPNCQGSNICRDDKTSELVCEDCGGVLDSFAVDESIEFVQNSGGGASLVSRFVSHDDDGTAEGALRVSRAITFKKGGDRINDICSKLEILGDTNVVAFAKSIFQDAVAKRLTWGRPGKITAAACVYLAARYKDKELMLTDIAEKCQLDVTNVFHVFTDLCCRLNLKVPFHDPCLFVARFAHALDLGERLSQVIKIATTLVRRMNADFITLGRYPTGIIAAALIFACRSVGISKSVGELVKVVRLHESTIRKRMMEFAQTDSAKMTAAELKRRESSGSSLPESEAPPCLKRQRLLAKLPPQPAPTQDEMDKLVKEINTKLEKAREKSQKMILARYMTGQLGDEDLEADTQEVILDELGKGLLNEDKSGDGPECSENDKEKTTKKKRPQFCPSLEGTGFEEKERDKNAPPKYPRLWQWAQEGDKRTVEMSAKDDGSLDLTGINDDELSMYLCASEQEISYRKRTFWDPEYDVFLKDKAQKKDLRLQMAKGTGARKKKRVSRPKQAEMIGNSAAESFTKMAKETELSKKFDNGKLCNLIRTLTGCNDKLLNAIEEPREEAAEVAEPSPKRQKKDKVEKAKSDKGKDSKVTKESTRETESVEIHRASGSEIINENVETEQDEVNLSAVTYDEAIDEADYFEDEDEDEPQEEPEGFEDY